MLFDSRNLDYRLISQPSFIQSVRTAKFEQTSQRCELHRRLPCRFPNSRSRGLRDEKDDDGHLALGSRIRPAHSIDRSGPSPHWLGGGARCPFRPRCRSRFQSLVRVPILPMTGMSSTLQSSTPECEGGFSTGSWRVRGSNGGDVGQLLGMGGKRKSEGMRGLACSWHRGYMLKNTLPVTAPVRSPLVRNLGSASCRAAADFMEDV